ncbi:MAG: GlsB/YeaQ/YmgE family stress response membrane protein [Acidobacteriota bacterium]
MISIIVFLILGFVAGYLAKIIMPGPDGGGTLITIVLGLVGAIVGGVIGSLLGYPLANSVDNLSRSVPSFVFSIIGAIVVLALYRLITGRRVTA